MKKLKFNLKKKKEEPKDIKKITTVEDNKENVDKESSDRAVERHLGNAKAAQNLRERQADTGQEERYGRPAQIHCALADYLFLVGVDSHYGIRNKQRCQEEQHGKDQSYPDHYRD